MQVAACGAGSGLGQLRFCRGEKIHIQAGHFDGRARGAEHFSVGLDGNARLIQMIRDWFADDAQDVTVNGGCIHCGFAIARTTAAKEGLEGGIR